MSKDLKKRKKRVRVPEEVISKSVKKRLKVQRESVADKVDVPIDDYEQDLINRMEDCRTIVNDLERSPVWRVVFNDIKSSMQLLDDNWQNIYEEKKLMEARILKMANMHVLSLKNKYAEELASVEADFSKLRNQDKEMTKDYDSE